MLSPCSARSTTRRLLIMIRWSTSVNDTVHHACQPAQARPARPLEESLVADHWTMHVLTSSRTITLMNIYGQATSCQPYGRIHHRFMTSSSLSAATCSKCMASGTMDGLLVYMFRREPRPGPCSTKSSTMAACRIIKMVEPRRRQSLPSKPFRWSACARQDTGKESLKRNQQKVAFLNSSHDRHILDPAHDHMCTKSNKANACRR